MERHFGEIGKGSRLEVHCILGNHVVGEKGRLELAILVVGHTVVDCSSCYTHCAVAEHRPCSKKKTRWVRRRRPRFVAETETDFVERGNLRMGFGMMELVD